MAQRRSLRELLTDVAFGGAKGYISGSQSDIPEVGLASGFLGGADTARTMQKQRADTSQENRRQKAMEMVYTDPEFRGLSVAEKAYALRNPDEYLKMKADRVTQSMNTKKSPLGIQNGRVVFVDQEGNVSFGDLPATGEVTKPGTPTTQKAPQGFRFKQEGDLEAIPGGPSDIKFQRESEKRQNLQSAAVTQADRIIGKVDQAMEKVGITTTGLGSALASVPGTSARDLANDLQTIKANLGFSELQAMRQASPTGGALGQVAVQELEALQATLASLNQSQSPQQLRDRLNEIKSHYERWKQTVIGNEQEQKIPQGSPPAQTTGERIRVRRKDTGQSGTIPAEKFDPGKHEKL